MRKIIRAGGLLCLIGASSAVAEGIPVHPGLWEMALSMQMPMLPAPQERTYTECVKETELNPEDFQMDQDSRCSVGDVEVEGNTISWSMECAGPMGPTRGNWSFTSTGDSMHGDGKMTTEASGQVMEFTMAWKGHRLGDCEEEASQ